MPESSEPGTAARANSAEVILTADLHARPAGRVARALATYDAKVLLTVEDRQADGRSVLAVMGLGATAGQALTVRAEGEHADQAVAAVVRQLTAPEAVAL